MKINYFRLMLAIMLFLSNSLLAAESAKLEIRKFYYPNGVLKQEVYFVNGKPEGTVKDYDEKGKLYRILKKDALFIYELEYERQSLVHGSQRIIKSGVLLEEFVPKAFGLMTVKTYYESGVVRSEGDRFFNVPVGTVKSYYEDGE